MSVSIPLSSLMPDAPADATVSVSDALKLRDDMLLYGTCFVKPNGEPFWPSHVRVPPTEVGQP